ncbi:RNA-dependent RNA polymerase protein [Sedlec virus]|uniref:RNA-directed RNA polymerase L n=1 Tax=Sedlec virus TaxID=1383888 RepID=A0A346JEY3_9VIRU|nr:RNA-dependent RNA polymerase protein [Sedlec virus]AXP32058.1 RNA-dependent RNA polymerase protein [Sedlec virus]
MNKERIISLKEEIEACFEADKAKDIISKLYVERHNYFARKYCEKANITYRNDVPASDICAQVLPPDVAATVERVTPDNYFIDGTKVYIIDFKVAENDDSSIATKEKYENVFGKVFIPHGIDFEVVIIRYIPHLEQTYIDSNNWLALFPNVRPNVNFGWYESLREMIMEKFKEDENFLSLISFGDFTLTAPWISEDTPELEDHNVFIKFMESMPPDEQRTFIECLNYSAYEGEKWNSLLKSIMHRYGYKYNAFIKSQSDEIFNMDGNYEKPNKDEIYKGWKEMIERVKLERDMSNNINDQKPSIHFIWSPPDPANGNTNIQKLLKLSKSLQKIKDTTSYTDAFRAIGKLMDISDDIMGYERFCVKLKNEARQSGRKIDKKINPVKCGTATVLWEQQFKLDTDEITPHDRSHLLKDFFGIGAHKRFKNRLVEDMDLEKPKILDFEDQEIIRQSTIVVKSVRPILERKSGLKKFGNYLDEYETKIVSASEDTWNTISEIATSQYWSSINDYSVLMKNMLTCSQYNRHNTFRVAMCANNSVFGLVMPSTDIKTKKSTLVYCIVTLHKEYEDVINPGSLFKTFQTEGGYVSISKAIRLDKERCQRIVIAPGLFLMTCALFKGSNPNVSLDDIMNFSYFTSLSITKAMLSLTEPARYMIMNSLAVSSHVREYIAEKFSPYTKTAFSVYMTQLIKKGCFNAFEQKDLIQLRDVYLTDFEITQKGVREDRNLQSIWFPGKVSIKEYINQVYLPFYFNSKGLHEKHHVLFDLAKTVLEIEKDQRQNIQHPWGEDFKKQTVNLDVLIYSLAKNLALDNSRHTHVRHRVESSNNFKRSITTISTFTSSKSCIQIGDFRSLKEQRAKRESKMKESDKKKLGIANPLFLEEINNEVEIHHANYNDLRAAVPEYIDFMSTKVFDRLYTMFKNKEIEDKPTIELVMDTMKNHKDFYFAFFNKGQKTAKDREIFLGEFEAKMCLYVVERIAKERCKLNPEEMISRPGDIKLKKLEQRAEAEIKYLSQVIREHNKRLNDLAGSGATDSEVVDLMLQKVHGLKIEINADMSKWSAQDVMYKYFWLFVLDPILYPAEKKRILYFFCNYMNKTLLLPDELMCSILDQRMPRENDIIREMTDNYRRNWVKIEKNWLQGNLNFTSSYVHSCSMSVYRDIVREATKRLDGQSLINSMVHSDDNHTSICMIQNKVPDSFIIQFLTTIFERVCLTFGNQANMKKTYLTNFIKEFVSLFNIYGEPFSIFGRFLLTAVGDCAYLGPYEDLASRLSATQTAIKHGCPPSLAWLSIALNHWITYTTYNMMPGQSNDPMSHLPAHKRSDIPIELCGTLDADLPTIALVGLEAGNLTYLVNLAHRLSDPIHKREPIQKQCEQIHEWDMQKLTKNDHFRLKLLRYIALDSTISEDDSMGQTSDMRSRSLLTPRKFTTSGSLIRLTSYNDFQDIIANEERTNAMFEYFVRKPELLVTKGENSKEFINSILLRYNSKRFKESLSIQNPTQLFIEQVLFSNKPIIDYTSIHDKFVALQDLKDVQEYDTIIGKKTFPEAFKQIVLDLSTLELDNDDIKTVYSFCLLNDPLMIAVANNLILSVDGSHQSRVGQSASTMPEFRNTKLIKHSPALVLRAYVKQDPEIPGAYPPDMARDLVHLENFITGVRLRENMRKRIKENEDKNGARDLKFEVKELTRFYQVCYDYVKSTEHKVKVFILPYKVHTAPDFCQAVSGNLVRDDCWVVKHHLKSIMSGARKGHVQTGTQKEYMVMNECFRLICHFADAFVDANSRNKYMNEVIDNFTYKGEKVSDLFKMLLKSDYRRKFLPLLFQTKNLLQSDLDAYDAEKADEQVTWNKWQNSRHLNIGEIDLVISGLDRQIRIVGHHDKLKIAQLTVARAEPNLITTHGIKLLNTEHGLRLEKMQRIGNLEENSFYIVWQAKQKNRYSYSILPTAVIKQKNKEFEESKTISKYQYVPICKVIVAEKTTATRFHLMSICKKNSDNRQLTQLVLSHDEIATVKRCLFIKMTFFEGPALDCKNIDLSKLMQTPNLLSINYDTISKTSILDIAKVFKCSGSNDLEDSDEIFLDFSDDPMQEMETVEIECVPMYTIGYLVDAEPNHTYRRALMKAFSEEKQRFMEQMDFTGDGFLSGENLGILEGICCLIKELETNQWSTNLMQCFHMVMASEGMDATFHMFDIPPAFLKSTITREFYWLEVQEFLEKIPVPKYEPWKSVIEHFISKASELVEKKLKEKRSKRTLGDYAKTLKRFEGKDKHTYT